MPNTIDLTSGPLTLVLEPSTGFVRYVRLGHIEVLRGIYAAVRDHNWDTVPAVVSNLSLEESEAGFRATFDAHHQSSGIDFTWRGSITGDATGRLAYEFDGIAHSTFRRNRIGFCVLHPSECKGKPCCVESADGSTEPGVFPFHISPHQPFKNMRAISYQVTPEIEAEVHFSGDVFEMEDQRNWTDASYKTYCTPLDLPFPVEVTKGTRIWQRVTLTLNGSVALATEGTHPDELPVELSVLPQRSPMPAIGLGSASQDQPLGPRQRDKLVALGLSHLRVDLPLFDHDWHSSWTHAVTEAQAIGVPLEVAVQLGGNVEVELAALADIFVAEPAAVARWLVFGRDHLAVAPCDLAKAREVMTSLAPDAMVGSGTNAYFTEFNRQRPSLTGMDVVAYSISPQVHAFDDASLVETLPMQAETVRSADNLVGDAPIAVTPITLRPRFNPNATGPEAQPDPGELPAQVDPRQASRFAAVWTLGSLKHLAEAGAASVTFYETTGWRGVMETEAGSPLPDRFPSMPGAVFPLYDVFASVAEFRDGQIQVMRSNQPLVADGALLLRGQSRRMLVANFQGQPTTMSILMPQDARQVMITPLGRDGRDETGNSTGAQHDRKGKLIHLSEPRLEVTLAPHGLLRLDWTATDHE